MWIYPIFARTVNFIADIEKMINYISIVKLMARFWSHKFSTAINSKGIHLYMLVNSE